MKKPSSRLLASLCVPFAIALTACGGGGGSDAANGQASTAAAVATPTATAAAPSAANLATSTPVASTSTAVANAPTTASTTPASSAPTVDITCGEAGFQAAVLAELNRRRAAGAVCGADAYPAAAPVGWNDKLAQAAYAHSLDMASNNYFSHTSLNGSTLSQRVDAQGYVWSTVGENIAAGYSGVQSVVQGWMDSPGHCRNIMNAAFNQVGMACSRVASSTYGSYFTLDLGAPR